ncbi:Rpn family recombination-promoting nuclease/putative transposase [Stieleria sp. JC731]|uniref:Rpn family recombination-promoting nuclease/putative transposase n=1 Tax=Pirellulaceae TaxID=2691357 RepID=UPI001E52F506|nr:Rpn family recombination-promoting nuclease/putative transposase [Stieleria sp. JC731]MCC9601573.1 Rpn family recombination-promoting nuclease/putative transposase [Stieleria sp. JC731]
MVIGIDPRVDFACKLLLGSPDHPAITIHFLNAVLGGEPKIAQVQIRNPIAGKRFDEDKLSILDILATDDHGRLIDIEIQTTLPAGLSRRLTYYAASQLIEQLGEGDSYRDLRPSIGICILDAMLFRDSVSLHLDFQLRSRTGERLTDCLQIHLLELPKYVPEADNDVPSDPIRQWMHFFRFAGTSTLDELHRTLPDPVFFEAIGVLEMIAKNPEERRFYEARLKMQRDEEARLVAAEERGEAIGEARGEARGEAIGRVRVLQSLVGVGESSVEQLRDRSLEELSAMEESLKQQLRERG